MGRKSTRSRNRGKQPSRAKPSSSLSPREPGGNPCPQQSFTDAISAARAGAVSEDPFTLPFRDPESFRISQAVADAIRTWDPQTPLLPPSSVLPPLL